MGEVADAYAGCRTRIVALTSDLDEQQAATSVPACPGWSVHDVVSHVSGVVEDVLAGRLEGVATPTWTSAQVTAGSGCALGELIARWCDTAPRFEAFLDKVGPRGRQAVADVVTHEHDIRGALHLPGARESDAVGIGLGFTASAFVEAARERGIAVRLSTGGGACFGSEDAPLSLSDEPFELLRAVTGRRSESQLRAMRWNGEPGGAIAAFTYGPFTPASHDIVE